MFWKKLALKESKNQKAVENTEKEDKNIYNSLQQLKVGTYQEAPKYVQDNEYLKNGYILNCNTYKKVFKSLFICHNETVNTWTHLLGAIFFVFLIWYTDKFISNFKSQIKTVKNDIFLLEKKTLFLNDSHSELNKTSPLMINNIYNSIKEMKIDLDNFNYKNIYENAINHLNIFNNSNFSNIPDNSENSNIKENKAINDFNINNISLLKKDLICLKEDVIDLINLDKNNNSNLNKELNLEKKPLKKLAKWPLFIIVISAILCLSFSASFHSMGTMSATHFNILNRFDYGGISLLISGSCYPPYYYFFYFSQKLKLFYLSEITIFGVGTFLYSLTDDFNKPKRRTLRGTLFLIFGLCTGIPVLHMAIFGDKIKGYNPNIKLINWYLGGISYVTGVIIYILRYPEKKFPGKFDFIGASHQIFHILVFFGAFFHFIGSIDAYNYRFGKLYI